MYRKEKHTTQVPVLNCGKGCLSHRGRRGHCQVVPAGIFFMRTNLTATPNRCHRGTVSDAVWGARRPGTTPEDRLYFLTFSLPPSTTRLTAQLTDAHLRGDLSQTRLPMRTYPSAPMS